MGAFLQKLGLTPGQIALLSKVFKISGGLCIALVVCVGALRISAEKAKNKKAAEQPSAVSEMYAYFEKKSRDLLPIDIAAHRFIADYYLKNDQPQKAIDHILRILPVLPAERGLMLNLATAYLQSGDYKSALETFSKLEQSDTTDVFSASIAARKGLTLFYCGDIRASTEYLNKCVTAFPRSAEALCFLGQVEAAQSNAAGKAEAYFKKSLQTDSTYIEARYQPHRADHFSGLPEVSRRSLLLVRLTYFLIRAAALFVRVCLRRRNAGSSHIRTSGEVCLRFFDLERKRQTGRQAALAAVCFRQLFVDRHHLNLILSG